MIKSFKTYLTNQGYKTKTPNGAPSTVDSYAKAVGKVVERENTDWPTLGKNISGIVKKYGPGGKEEDFGNKSHSTCINALRRFEEFVNVFKISASGAVKKQP